MGSPRPIPFPTNFDQSGCCGPFPFKSHTPPSNGQTSDKQANEIGCSSKNRRRTLELSPTTDTANFPVRTLFVKESNNLPDIDLPRSDRNPFTFSNLLECNTIPSISEIEATAEVGAMVGFEIDNRNKLLAEILGVSDEATVAK